MKKALASVIIITFAGILTTTVLAMFSDTSFAKQYFRNQALQSPYFVVY